MTFFVTTLYNTNSHLNPIFTNVYVTYITVTPNLNEWKSEQAHIYPHAHPLLDSDTYKECRCFTICGGLRRVVLTKKTQN